MSPIAILVAGRHFLVGIKKTSIFLLLTIYMKDRQRYGILLPHRTPKFYKKKQDKTLEKTTKNVHNS